MAGARGNVAWIAFQTQSEKGVAATPAKEKAIRTGVTSGVIGPSREIGRLSETDANRDQGIAYVKKDGLKGNPDIYVRANSIAAVLQGVIGSDAITAGTPTIHTITPTNGLPYFTVWTMLNEGGATAASEVEELVGSDKGKAGAQLWEEHENCIFSDVNIKATAGSPLTSTITLLGTKTTRKTSNPLGAEAPVQEAGAPFTMNMAEITLGGKASHLISSFDLVIGNAGVEQQTDSASPYDIVVGRRSVTLTFDLFFENLKEYDRFHYGGAEGTAISPNIYETEATFKFKISANESIEFILPHIAYEEFPLQPNAEGTPIVVPVKAIGQRSSGNVIEAIVKNSHKEKYGAV